MIPNDLAARLRLLVESAVQPLPQIRPLPADLPAFERGQRFNAQIQSALPDGSFRAVVAGKTVTLSLEHAARPGDTLELVVVERTPRWIAAALASPSAAAAAAQTQAPTLSRAAQLIGALLTGARETPPQPAALARGTPLMAAPPANAVVLAPLLKQAAVQSGLFYESHQAAWVAGRMPLAALLAEPQGRLSPMLATAQANPESGLAATTDGARPAGGGEQAGAGAAARHAEAKPALTTPTQAAVAAAAAADETEARPAGATERPAAPAASMPRDLAPIVQQQLDALATHHLAWQGQVWPGQTVQWQIEEPLRERGGGEPAEAENWRTTLRLSMPELGELAATLSLGPAGVAVTLDAREAAALPRLRGGAEALRAALAAAGIPLTTLKVDRDGSL